MSAAAAKATGAFVITFHPHPARQLHQDRRLGRPRRHGLGAFDQHGRGEAQLAGVADGVPRPLPSKFDWNSSAVTHDSPFRAAAARPPTETLRRQSTIRPERFFLPRSPSSVPRLRRAARSASEQGPGIVPAGRHCPARHGFPKGSGDGHHLINRSGATAVYLEVGARSPDDVTTCSDVDVMSSSADGRFVHKDGTPYPGA